jgi:hypothetical protein
VERARRYSWEAVADEYEALLARACLPGVHGALPPDLVDAPAPPPAGALAPEPAREPATRLVA